MVSVELAMLAGFGSLLLLCLLRVPIGLAMGAAGILGFGLLSGFEPAFRMLSHSVIGTLSDYTMGLIPLFILMGAIAVVSGLSEDLFRAARFWLGSMRGGLAAATVASCGGFSAICGSSAATAATMTRVALPEMLKLGYSEKLATGVIAAGGTLGVLIPPSIALAVYGLLTQQSVGLLFLAGVLPGLVAISLYLITIALWLRVNPAAAPSGSRASWAERFGSLRRLGPILLLSVFVIGGIYGGLFTPTEAGALGAAGVIVLTAAMGTLSWRRLFAALADSVRTAAAILLIMAGAVLFGYFLAVTEAPQRAADMLATAELGRYGTLMVILAIMLLLGCVIDALAVVILVVPIVYPIVMQLGFDPIWFGVVVTMCVEVGLVTPPFGLNVFVIKGVAKHTSIWTIYRGVMPFIASDLVRIGLLILFPSMALFLPSLMR